MILKVSIEWNTCGRLFLLLGHSFDQNKQVGSDTRYYGICLHFKDTWESTELPWQHPPFSCLLSCGTKSTWSTIVKTWLKIVSPELFPQAACRLAEKHVKFINNCRKTKVREIDWEIGLWILQEKEIWRQLYTGVNFESEWMYRIRLDKSKG